MRSVGSMQSLFQSGSVQNIPLSDVYMLHHVCSNCTLSNPACTVSRVDKRLLIVNKHLTGKHVLKSSSGLRDHCTVSNTITNGIYIHTCSYGSKYNNVSTRYDMARNFSILYHMIEGGYRRHRTVAEPANIHRHYI